MGLRGFAVVAVLLCAHVAYADPDAKPWAVGVTEANQKLALEKFQAGNELFVKDEFRKALDLYLEALQFWDHPNVRYNAAICLIKLDRMVEAYEHMTAAMRFGEPPLGKALHAEGKNYLKLLANQVSYLEIHCKAPTGARVTLDGQTLFDECPGTQTRLVTPGTHQIVGAKQGYRTETREIEVAPGGKETIEIVMRLESQRKVTRRWARWVPWTVVATSAAVAAVGVPLWVVTQGKFDDYDKAVRTKCSQAGCAPGEIVEFDDQLSSARTYRALTYSAIGIGATGVAVGLVLVLMNSPRLGPAVVAPQVGADHASLTLSGSW